MTTSTILWTPVNEASERAAHRKELDALLRVYRRNPKLRKLADQIHHQRLLGGRACAQCIRIAMRKLEIPIPCTS